MNIGPLIDLAAFEVRKQKLHNLEFTYELFFIVHSHSIVNLDD